MKLGIAAFIGGTDDEEIENVIRSMSSRAQIPFIETHWKTSDRPPDEYAVNLYPDPSLLSKASKPAATTVDCDIDYRGSPLVRFIFRGGG
jgi:hypothetical protein